MCNKASVVTYRNQVTEFRDVYEVTSLEITELRNQKHGNEHGFCRVI